MSETVKSSWSDRAVAGTVIEAMNSLAAALSPVHQQYLLEARQMQALSFAVHIPLVCFGIAFPAMVLFAEWMGMRTGDPVYRTVARRWSRIVLALFAVGVITGTILSFEMGLLWPNFTATFGSVFGLGFAIEGFSFFVEGSTPTAGIASPPACISSAASRS
jgi:cytochrome bd ubiquinol oxidase subunit I